MAMLLFCFKDLRNHLQSDGTFLFPHSPPIEPTASLTYPYGSWVETPAQPGCGWLPFGCPLGVFFLRNPLQAKSRGKPFRLSLVSDSTQKTRHLFEFRFPGYLRKWQFSVEATSTLSLGGKSLRDPCFKQIAHGFRCHFPFGFHISGGKPLLSSDPCCRCGQGKPKPVWGLPYKEVFVG